jgi:hypothetical protein
MRPRGVAGGLTAEASGGASGSEPEGGERPRGEQAVVDGPYPPRGEAPIAPVSGEGQTS